MVAQGWEELAEFREQPEVQGTQGQLNAEGRERERRQNL